MKNNETSKRLSEAMNDINIKAVDLAQKAGVSKGAISQYLNGTTKIGNINAGKLSDVLGVSPLWLMGFDVAKKDEPKLTINDSKKDLIMIEMEKMSDQSLDYLIQYAQFLNSKREE